ncbi:MAG: hypothetical protein LW806_03085 [Planctomycetaceae bacterium]|nr:hypothetical protein [Planctomycetaceae bacterium]
MSCAVCRIIGFRISTALSAVAVSAAAWIGATAHGGGDQPAFLSVPRVSVQSTARFRGVLEGAREEIVRMMVLGDSQETMPGGFGATYLPHLNARFAEVYGPAGESMLYTNIGMQSPPHWLSSQTTSSARVPTTVPSSAVLPAVVVHRLLEDDGTALGAFRTLFLHDAAASSEASLVDGPWFDRVGPFSAEILAVARSAPTAVRWVQAPSDGNVVAAGAPPVAKGTLSLPAKAAVGSFHWLQTPVLDFAGRRHLQLYVSGASSKVGTDVAGVRFRSLGAPRGVVVQSFARGGMRLQDVLGEHGTSGAFLRAMNPTVIVLHFGANDAAYGIGLDEWRTRLIATIGWIRAELGQPDFPVILASDLRSGPYAGFAILDAMPGIAHEIAMQDPDVLALNLPRIVAEEYIWLDRRPYLFDAAHLRSYAQRMLAEAFVGELCDALQIPDPGCDQAEWSDCVRTLGSTCAYGGCVLVTDVDAEQLALPWNGPGTDCSDANGDGFADLCPPAATADINGDGSVNAADLGILLAAWGEFYPAADLDYDGEVGASDLSILLAQWGS